jgi:predicted O-methyltransferase YrrM
VDSKIVPEMSHPTSACPHPELWSAYDGMATECEVLDCLYALVRMLKPKVVIETGCYNGHGTEALARGIAANGFGNLRSCDLGSQQVTETEKRLFSIDFSAYPYPQPCSSLCLIQQCSGVELITNCQNDIDFAFLDSGMDTPRIDELRALYPKLSPGGVVAIHDSGIQFGLREFHLGKTLRELNMQHIFFDTPRGLCLCRKMPEIYP